MFLYGSILGSIFGYTLTYFLTSNKNKITVKGNNNTCLIVVLNNDNYYLNLINNTIMYGVIGGVVGIFLQKY